MRTVLVKLLKDGSGRVCIHWFVRDEAGKITTPSSVTTTALGPIALGGVRGRIACMPKLTSVLPTQSKGQINTCAHSDDVRAVTCPECRATDDYKIASVELGEMVDTANPGESLRQWQTVRKE